MIKVIRLNEKINHERIGHTVYVKGLTLKNIQSSDVYKDIVNIINNREGYIQTSSKEIHIYVEQDVSDGVSQEFLDDMQKQPDYVSKKTVKYTLEFIRNKELRSISTLFYTKGLH